MSASDLVARQLPDVARCLLFAPPDRRPALFTLWAFVLELERAASASREPAIRAMRLAFWRGFLAEAEAGRRPPRHEIGDDLAGAMQNPVLSAAALGGLVEASPAFGPPLFELAARLLGGGDSAANARRAGQVWDLARAGRSAEAHALRQSLDPWPAPLAAVFLPIRHAGTKVSPFRQRLSLVYTALRPGQGGGS